MEILIVDDSKAMRMIVKRTLRQAGFDGHNVRECADGLEALQAIAQTKPDMILCDWNMPEMNGIDLLKKLNEDGVATTFGFVTSEGTDDIRQTAREAGALFFITKPLTPEKFQEALTPLMVKS